MADLTVTLTEALSLNGYDQGSSTVRTISGITKSSKTILTITTNEAIIATMSGAVASAGHFNDSFVRYMRLEMMTTMKLL